VGPINLTSALSRIPQLLSTSIVGGPVIKPFIGPSPLPRFVPQLRVGHSFTTMLSAAQGRQMGPILSAVQHAPRGTTPLLHATGSNAEQIRDQGFDISRPATNGMTSSAADGQRRTIFTLVREPVAGVRTLYHGTTGKHAATLRQEGTLRPRPHHPNDYLQAGKGVYVTTSREAAQYWGEQADRPRTPKIWDDPQEQPAEPFEASGVKVIEVYPPEDNPAYNRIVVPWEVRAGMPSDVAEYIASKSPHEAVVASSAPGPEMEEEILLTARAAKDPNVEIRFWVPDADSNKSGGGSDAT